MGKTLAIAKKEIKSNFVTPLAYVVISGFLILAGFFFFTLLQQFNTILVQAALMPDVNPSLNEWVVEPFWQTLEVVMIFLLPILTMRSIADERRSGTFEMLATSPISAGQLVLGKFLGLLVVVFLLLVLTFCFPLALIVFADPEVPPILVGAFGLFIYSAAYLALGIGISSFTKSQTVSGVISLVFFLILYVIDAPAEKVGGTLAEILKYLAPSNHIAELVRGVIAFSDLAYFVSVILLGLFIASRVVEAQNLR